jgi:hypothetical protein
MSPSARGQAGAQRVQLGVLRGERAGAGQRRLGGLQIAAPSSSRASVRYASGQAGHDLDARAGDLRRRVGLAEPQVRLLDLPRQRAIGRLGALQRQQDRERLLVRPRFIRRSARSRARIAEPG